MAGDKGFPDLVLAREGQLILAELKTDTGKPTDEQRAWLAALGAHGRLWRPAHWDEVQHTLGITRRPPPSAEDVFERTTDAAYRGPSDGR